MTEEERLEIIKMAYEEHAELVNDEEHADIRDFQRGTLFGIRFTLIALGYEFDFDEWEPKQNN